ncbi:YmfQ family protein [Herminiimonas contaminans]|uniref:DUF2313 domain-containing protein n=1 Tax=Herminiimonas contaminans TaxID=1111140 RepID=A0ABS0EZ56_9BURK|nr:putative phage tail protein [Herminiimonas contaminans]MBF8179668.1 DUF2313 domain-containing protein [Herminiimonas contaminans]
MDPFSKEDYASVYQQLQPTGLAWPTSKKSLWRKLYNAFGRMAVSVHATLLLLTRELDPRSTSQLLNEWEKFAGLPDECVIEQGTESERRAAVHSKITATGGASAEYFISVANALGYAGATVTEFPVARFGRARFGTARFHDRRWRNVWQLNLHAPGPVPARFLDRFGVRFYQSASPVLECRIRKLKPSHTQAFFHYGE